MQQLISDLETIVSSQQSEGARIHQVAARLGGFVSGHPHIDTKWTRPCQETYARRLIHRDARNRFVVVAMTWSPGHATPVHDHGTWGVVGMLQNRISAWGYRRVDDGSRDGYAELEEVGYMEAAEGTVLPVVLPPDDEIHKLQNKWDEVAVGIHIYGKDIERCRRYDLAAKRWEWYGLSYRED